MTEKDKIDICGVLVQVIKSQAQQVENSLNSISGVEVHGLSEGNRFVVTIEQETQAQIINIIEGFDALSGVVSTALVYQHSEAL
ncbi:MAG: chaperone NapD [Gammaproteobacteria bacterium]|nr:chaperone NapD [Gammaproteobacteria bacterium]